MKNNVLPRREREKLRQRHDIIKAALDLFSEFGYHNVSMHKIAKKAECQGRLKNVIKSPC
ncbi:TetR/AcrR family transcriptional regulator [Desulfobacterium sp. N47]|uniref:HTH tetR-type domain-containing protein n=1 Tax=uncultured Desulfobacterium sp. TaxID=201089 RepID=E1Y8Y9_9BACT|nr:hypothetical protein N47_A10620 [uncultured Desulfobacterium sp.]